MKTIPGGFLAGVLKHQQFFHRFFPQPTKRCGSLWVVESHHPDLTDFKLMVESLAIHPNLRWFDFLTFDDLSTFGGYLTHDQNKKRSKFKVTNFPKNKKQKIQRFNWIRNLWYSFFHSHDSIDFLFETNYYWKITPKTFTTSHDSLGVVFLPVTQLLTTALEITPSTETNSELMPPKINFGWKMMKLSFPF